MLVCVAGLCLGIVLLWKKLSERADTLSNRTVLLIIAGVLLPYLALQIYIGFQLAVDPSWDFGQVYHIVLDRVTTGELTERVDYLTLYPNNKGGAFLLFIYYRLIALFGFPLTGDMPIYAGIVLNCLLINVSIFLLCVFFLRCGKKAPAIAGLVVSVGCLGLLLYTPVFYTDTLSLLFPPILLNLFINLEKHSTRVARMADWIAVILVTVVGMSVKLTILFFLIAYSIYKLATAVKGRALCLTALRMAGVAVLVIVVNLATTAVYNHYVVGDSQEEAISYKHWIHMGMMGNGGYNDSVWAIEGEVGIDEALRNQWASYTPNTYFRFLTNKNVFTWGDGLYFSNAKIVRYPLHPDSLVYRAFINEEGAARRTWIFYANICNGVQLFFIICSFIRMFRSEKWDLFCVLRIAFFGLFLFLMIWETRSRYLVNYIPVFVILAIDGIDYLSEKRRGLRQLGRRLWNGSSERL